jgi:hypothetical protein
MNGEFLMVGTPLSDVNENQIPQSAFQRVLQRLYQSERLDGVPGYHLHFTQLLRQEKVN